MEPQRGAPLRASRHQSTRRRDENQERAYIAASRRTDRSIEARLQSAHKASDLHKKRTGKSLRITEQIVFNDETYEEEDRWTPSRSVLGPRLQTPSADLNSRVEAYLEQKIVMSTFVAAAAAAAADRQQQQQQQQQQQGRGWGEIDRLFAESFPNAAQTARRLAEDMVPGKLPANHQPPTLPGHEGTTTTTTTTGAEPWVTTAAAAVPWQLQGQEEACVDDAPPPPPHARNHGGGPHGSAFTADLPPEVLLFLDHEGAVTHHSHAEEGLKGRRDACFGGFAFCSAAAAADADDTQRDVGGEDPDPDPATAWNDELDAYLDATAWLGLPTEGQCLAMEGEGKEPR